MTRRVDQHKKLNNSGVKSQFFFSIVAFTRTQILSLRAQNGLITLRIYLFYKYQPLRVARGQDLVAGGQDSFDDLEDENRGIGVGW